MQEKWYTDGLSSALFTTIIAARAGNFKALYRPRQDAKIETKTSQLSMNHSDDRKEKNSHINYPILVHEEDASLRSRT